MEKRSIMIIGAGLNQLNLIRSAKESGYKTIVVDPNERAPGRALSDVFVCLPPQDFQGHCEIIEKYGIEGIVTSQMEKPLQFMARLAGKYGFAFLSRESTEWARNKFLMKQRFLQGGVPCAAGFLLKSNKPDLVQQVKSLGFPMIMKPLDAFSSRGVYVINSLEELEDKFATTASFSSDGSVLVEEYIGGKMISVEGFVFQNETNIVQYTERYKFTPKPLRVELGHIQPATLSEKEREEITIIIRDAVKALCLNNCGIHAELKINTNGIFMIEIGARLAGDFNASHLVPLSTGINLEKVIAQIAMQDKPELPKPSQQYVMIKWLELREGATINHVPEIKGLISGFTGIAECKLFVNPGGSVPYVTDSSKRAGFVITVGKSRETVEKNALEVEKRIRESIEYRPSFEGVSS